MLDVLMRSPLADPKMLAIATGIETGIGGMIVEDMTDGMRDAMIGGIKGMTGMTIETGDIGIASVIQGM
jgi:hypothetical protein